MARSRETSGELSAERRFVFGAHEFEPDSGLLHQGDKEIRLSPRPAALLRALAERATQVVTKQELIATLWNGRAVGDDALTSCVQELRRALGDDPRRPSLIETLHRRGYRLLVPCQPVEARRPVSDDMPPAVPVDRPSIAVLPFRNMSGDPEQEYFADGMVEEIITALSRFRSLFVIARNSSFTYKGRAVDVKQVGRELGVRYVLEGSVRKAASRLRVTAQLIDTAAGVHIWADRFDGALEDVFDLQDQVTEKVVAALAPTLERAEMLRARRKPPGNLDAYDHYLRGLAEIPLHTREDADRLSAHISKAIELDPGFAPASGLAASCCAFRKGFGWWSNTEGELIEATRLAQAAARLGQDDAVVLCQAGYVFAYVLHDLRAGRNGVDQALALNPNVALAWAISGWIHLWQGEPSLAFEHFHRAMRLSPLDLAAAHMQSGMAHACYFLNRYDEACSWAVKLLQPRPSHLSGLRIAAASAALGGQDALVRQMGTRILALFPGFRVSSLKDHLGPYQKPDFVAKYAAGLRRAGLPD